MVNRPSYIFSKSNELFKTVSPSGNSALTGQVRCPTEQVRSGVPPDKSAPSPDKSGPLGIKTFDQFPACLGLFFLLHFFQLAARATPWRFGVPSTFSWRFQWESIP
jgi:hypothetical protein